MDFSIRTFAVVELFGIDIWITETIVGTWFIMAVLIIAALVLRRLFFRNPKEIPESRLQNIVELIVESMEKFATGPLGEKYAWLDNWFFMLFVFLLFANISGLIGMRPPTADTATTIALAVTSFMLIQSMAFRFAFKRHFKSFFEPFPLFLPMNIIGEFAIIISLSFRLFGNILAGTILMGLVYALPWWVVITGFPAMLHVYFDLFAGAIQAYIFCMLSMSFVGNKLKTT